MALTASPRARNGASAVPEGERGTGISQAEVPLYPRRRQSLGTRRQRIVAAVIIVGALGFLIERGLANAIDYYLTANQAVAQRAQLGDNDFRIQGTVLPGVHQVGTTLQFAITSHHVDVKVVSTGAPGQLFRVGMPVVLDGHWQGDVYSSFQIMVQHGSTYVEAHPTKSKSAAGKP
jgi:cytochrome c-type biogenesis protein CcmE